MCIAARRLVLEWPSAGLEPAATRRGRLAPASSNTAPRVSTSHAQKNLHVSRSRPTDHEKAPRMRCPASAKAQKSSSPGRSAVLEAQRRSSPRRSAVLSNHARQLSGAFGRAREARKQRREAHAGARTAKVVPPSSTPAPCPADAASTDRCPESPPPWSCSHRYAPTHGRCTAARDHAD